MHYIVMRMRLHLATHMMLLILIISSRPYASILHMHVHSIMPKDKFKMMVHIRARMFIHLVLNIMFA